MRGRAPRRRRRSRRSDRRRPRRFGACPRVRYAPTSCRRRSTCTCRCRRRYPNACRPHRCQRRASYGRSVQPRSRRSSRCSGCRRSDSRCDQRWCSPTRRRRPRRNNSDPAHRERRSPQSRVRRASARSVATKVTRDMARRHVPDQWQLMRQARLDEDTKHAASMKQRKRRMDDSFCKIERAPPHRACVSG